MRFVIQLCIVLAGLLTWHSASAQEASASDLAKAAQNPIASLISVPIQSNIDFDWGPNSDTFAVTNIQPVLPFKLNDDWNLVTRTILPIVDQNDVPFSGVSEFGLADTVQSFFFSPKAPSANGWIWGVGPALLLPTATDEVLGAEKWGIGPTAVALKQQGPWTFGGLANHIESIAGDSDRGDVNQSLIQPFVNYNLPNGWYLVSSPIINANWEADSSETWTLPVGGGFGKIFRIGRQPVNAQIQAFYNVETPDSGADWQLRLQWHFLFPK